jgi:DNA-binding LacI/PurR family transcriptional regulator
MLPRALLAPSQDDSLLGWIRDLPVPSVLVERQPGAWAPAEWVRTDHAPGLALAVQHLREQGHRRIGLVLARDSPTSPHLLRAWHAARADPALAAVLMPQGFVTPGPGLRILRECRRAGITALVVHSDPQAVSLARCCAELSLLVPGDLAIVSYDDEVAHLAEPALTAVRPPKTHVGRLAVELMVARPLGGARRPAHRVLLAPDLVVRASSVTRP